MNINIGILFIIIFLSLILGIVLGALFSMRRQQTIIQSATAELQQTQADLLHASTELASTTAQKEQLEKINTSLQEKKDTDLTVLHAFEPIKLQLNQVNEKLQKLDKETTSRGEKVFTQLEQEAKLRSELAKTAQTLSSALTNSSARGNWGEIQLKRLIEASGMLEHIDYDTQVTQTNKQKPDVVISLPKAGKIAIDSKVPLASYLKAQELNGNDEQSEINRKKYLKEHSSALNNHIKELVKRNYPENFPNSPQLTIMFLPAEAILSEAINQDINILENALKQGIILASPSSLLAILRTIASLWSAAAITNEAEDILALGKELTDRLSKVMKHLDSLGSSLTKSVDEYNKTIGSLERNVLSTSRKFQSIQPTSAKNFATPMQSLDTEKTTIRELKALPKNEIEGSGNDC